jgi:hypothetical protein
VGSKTCLKKGEKDEQGRMKVMERGVKDDSSKEQMPELIWMCFDVALQRVPLSPFRDLSQMHINCPFNLCSPAASFFG